MYDALDRYEIPRVEKIDQTVLVFMRHPLHTESGLYTTTFTIMLTPKYFITICPGKSQITENILLQESKICPSQQSKFLIYILLKITQEYTVQIK